MGDQDQVRTSSSQYSSDRRPSGPRSGGPRGERRGGKFTPRPKICQFCVDKVKRIDYKQADTLRRFVSERGKIRPRRQTGTCARHQRYLTTAIKRARHLAMLPFVGQSLR
ncbi:MAG TPA: 30S ribosomal protein S18 [Anaerolineae bacterium]|nr:30S ribosomal protein S18 [Anaerolineae bacterium]